MNTRKKNPGSVAGAFGVKAFAFLVLLPAVSFTVFPRTGISFAEGPPVLTAEQAAGIREILTERVDKYHKTVGIAVGVVNERGRQVIGCGRLEKKGKEQVDGGTVFEIGSITKVFTALLLARMAEAGELSLDDPVSRLLPGSVRVPGREGKEITLLQLATHTSGLPRLPTNFFPGDMGNPYADYTAEKLYEFLSGYELKREIGGEYSYSNLGGGLLGHTL
ncbi:MAG: beta-lactamase family protein, partial [Candidatus Glassbacteria bacterium]|nr:beta-lactamase family protein [Candidatus Glassbacteria bacterium]